MPVHLQGPTILHRDVRLFSARVSVSNAGRSVAKRARKAWIGANMVLREATDVLQACCRPRCAFSRRNTGDRLVCRNRGAARGGSEAGRGAGSFLRSEEHTSELQS